MTKSKTIFTAVTPDLTPSQVRSLFYGRPATLLPAWGDGSDPARFFGEDLGLTDKEAYLAFREELRATLRQLAALQTGLARRTRVRGGDQLAQMYRSQLRPLVTVLIAIRRAGKAWSVSRSREPVAEAA